jgi:outer membrane lipoprotein SlyB
MNRCLVWILLCTSIACPPAVGQVLPSGFGLNGATFVVRLVSPLSTRTGRQGDKFAANVEQPAAYQGAVLEGRITKLSKPKKGVGNGKAKVQFQFDTLTFNNRTARVAADLQEVRNSQGVKNVDEEGQVIGKTSNKKRVGSTLVGAALGAAIGAAVAGGSGAAAGAVAGGAAGLAYGLTMTTTGSEIEFKTGSVFVLTVSDANRRQ